MGCHSPLQFKAYIARAHGPQSSSLPAKLESDDHTVVARAFDCVRAQDSVVKHGSGPAVIKLPRREGVAHNLQMPAEHTACAMAGLLCFLFTARLCQSTAYDLYESTL